MSNSVISNGDVEMESEEEDDGAPLPHLPLPKVGKPNSSPLPNCLSTTKLTKYGYKLYLNGRLTIANSVNYIYDRIFLCNC